jgi:hypothetical protein
MSPSALGLVLAALCAVPEGQSTLFAEMGIPLVPELLQEALPAPPNKVLLQANYYGTVTLDHPAHLARGIRCKDCHGAGRVGPIEFTPRLAHERCRGCHVDLKKGPTDCKACHVLPPAGPQQAQQGPSPALVGAAAAVAAGQVPAPASARTSTAASSAAAAATATSAGAAASAAAASASDLPAPDALGPAGSAMATSVPMAAAAPKKETTLAAAETRDGQDRRFEAVNGLDREPSAAAAAGGPTTLVQQAPGAFLEPPSSARPFQYSVYAGGLAGSATGLSVHVVSRMEGWQLSHAIDVLSGGSGSSRTLLLLGGGRSLPLRLPATLDLSAEVIAGADAVTHGAVDLRPALGARLGLEWTPFWSRGASATLALTGVMDMFQGGLASPACLYVTIGIGARIRRGEPVTGGLAAAKPAGAPTPAALPGSEPPPAPTSAPTASPTALADARP